MPDVPAPATTELQNKLNAVLRYGGSNAATVFTIMGVLSILSPEQIVEMKTQLDLLQQSILTAYGALTKMGVILGPVAAIWLAKVGWNSSTIQSMAGKLLGIAKSATDPKAGEAQVAIASAAADKTIVGDTGGVVAKPEIAMNPATPPNVVTTPADLPKG